MDKKNEAFLERLISTFKIEAAEHLTAISSCLVELEKSPGDERKAELVERAFREAHSMKGAARAVNLADIESASQSLESVFSAIKKKKITLTTADFDVLYRGVDFLSSSLPGLGKELTAEQKAAIKVLVSGLEEMSKSGRTRGASAKPELLKGGYPPAEQSATVISPAEEKMSASETVRIPAERLGKVLLQAEEFLYEKSAAGLRATELAELRGLIEDREKKWKKLRLKLRAIAGATEKSERRGEPGREDDRLTKFLELLESNVDFVTVIGARVIAMQKSAERDRRALGLMIDNLAESMKSVLMVPVSSLLELFPKVVRDLSHAQGKEAQLIIKGGDVEIDRRVLDEMKDPFIHLLRNCIDHGIEKPEQREKKGKSRLGSIFLSFSHVENKRVAITISDDGAGIDTGKVRDSAVRLGILSPERAAGIGDEALRLVFQSGVSTCPVITDLSGRGLGLAIVKEKVDGLNGTVSCESRAGKTVFHIELPLTLSAFRGVVVRIDEHLFILPSINVERTIRVGREVIRTIENRETITLGGTTLPLVPLQAVLELSQKEKEGSNGEFLLAVVLTAAEKRIAFSVDEVLNEEEVLVKGLGRQLSRVRNVSGAAVLGTGEVVPILNVPDLMKSAVKSEIRPVRSHKEEARPAKKVLVVEDSITARTLLKNILENAGYDVRTAVDGVDAFTLLKNESFDILVSDVDMPRMNGFDLTSRVRDDRKLADLPVILVTALESSEDRERGIDVGANAYIVKSSFDQSNLLETMKRLI